MECGEGRGASESGGVAGFWRMPACLDTAPQAAISLQVSFGEFVGVNCNNCIALLREVVGDNSLHDFFTFPFCLLTANAIQAIKVCSINTSELRLLGVFRKALD